jgi:hypothetical protein
MDTATRTYLLPVSELAARGEDVRFRAVAAALHAAAGARLVKHAEYRIAGTPEFCKIILSPRGQRASRCAGTIEREVVEYRAHDGLE